MSIDGFTYIHRETSHDVIDRILRERKDIQSTKLMYEYLRYDPIHEIRVLWDTWWEKIRSEKYWKP